MMWTRVPAITGEDEDGIESISGCEAIVNAHGVDKGPTISADDAAGDVYEAPSISVSNDEGVAPIVSGYEIANNAHHDVDKGPITGNEDGKKSVSNDEDESPIITSKDEADGKESVSNTGVEGSNLLPKIAGRSGAQQSHRSDTVVSS
jgi:hypothetical protein